MAEAVTKLPVKVESKAPARSARSPELSSLMSLRSEIDRIFDNFDRGFLGFPSTRSLFDVETLFPRSAAWDLVPAVDVAENDKHYEITAELPGIDEKNVELKVSNGILTINGEKEEKKEEKEKGYYLSERSYGSFQRSFQLPDGVDTDKIEANYKKGILTVTLPKTPEAQKAEKKIPIKAA